MINVIEYSDIYEKFIVLSSHSIGMSGYRKNVPGLHFQVIQQSQNVKFFFHFYFNVY